MPEGGDLSMAKPPNLLLIITDQQRRPMHWPQDQEWLDELMPADAELARTGISFEETSIASCMCSPSRASLFTGRWPAEHGVDLTLTRGGAKIDREHSKHALRKGIESVRSGEMSPLEMLGNTVKGALRRPNGGTDERELDPNMENLPSVLKRAGYKTVLKGKWHLSQPVGDDWSEADAERLADEYGFEGWVPPDAGENIEPSHFGGGSRAGKSKEGYDEDFTRQAEEFLADPPEEPWALIFSLVNPHDVLGYPSSYEEGGYSDSDWADLDAVQLPPTVDETLKNKPRAHALLKMGQLGFLGPIEASSVASTAASMPISTGSPIPRSEGCWMRSVTRRTLNRCVRRPSSSGPPTTATSGCPTAACARRCSTPTKRRSTCP